MFPSLVHALKVLLLLGIILLTQGLAREVNILDGNSPFSREVQRLFVIILLFSIGIVVVVYGGLSYVLFRFRHHGRQAMVEEEAPDIATPAHLETIWTVIPFFIVLVIFGFTVQSLFSYARVPPDALVVRSTAHQFWWDFEYPEYGFKSPNELVVPQGRAVRLEAQSADVIHALWSPNLSANIDHNPGQKISGWFRAEQAGIYYGLCNQICGSSHARMLFRVVVLPPQDFERFVSEARSYRATSTASTQRGAQLFQSQCAGCHRIAGTQAQGQSGPDLSWFGSRLTLGAGIHPNSANYLKPWIRNAASFKPEVRMPAFPGLAEADLDALVEYLYSLKLTTDFKALKEH